MVPGTRWAVGVVSCRKGCLGLLPYWERMVALEQPAHCRSAVEEHRLKGEAHREGVGGHQMRYEGQSCYLAAGFPTGLVAVVRNWSGYDQWAQMGCPSEEVHRYYLQHGDRRSGC